MTEEIDRRTTLAGLGAIGLTAAACGSAQVPPGGGRKLGYAIVGLGSYATRQIMPRFKDCRFSRLTALVSGTPSKLEQYGEEYGIPGRNRYSYANFDSIRSNPDVDIVYIILPNSMHAEYTVRAARAGKHVMCEKPMAVSSAECQQMIAACRQANRKLMIGYRSRFQPHNIEAIRLARSRAVGKPGLIESEHGFTIGDPTQWRLKRALSGGGSLMDIGIYSVQALRYMAGEEPVSVSSTEFTDRRDVRFRDCEDRIAFNFLFPSGLIGQGFSSYNSNHNHLRLSGDKGWIDLDPATSYGGQKMRVRIGSDEREVDPPAGPGANQFAAQLDHLSQCVLTNREPIVNGEEGLRDLRVMEAIYRSMKEGRTIRL
ncbi:Gfo/Idh/MocA family oxidoreductase [Sphingomonas piscis]|uniref:Gfo/Idh/MocA family oxidoreductase n=1 Tax=Sphingomonas piscis TaxID=2714943 RepID=A0A6G7YNE6_9SPHN|nr:Gfo/Idh/MocA family oxidoreductase [Sphingomonas piscis]QIK78270.1 Gfo/Idh/MocA family oxidoreductase [Sphingomonas piscis]